MIRTDAEYPYDMASAQSGAAACTVEVVIKLMGKEDRPCHFTKGTYRVTVTITVTPHGYLPKVLTYDSNYFIVPPSENLMQEPP